MRGVKVRLALLMFLQYAVWGTYLLSLGAYLSSVGCGNRIGWFFALQGVVSLFMPALMGIVADRWVNPKHLYIVLHILSAIAMGVMWHNGQASTLSFSGLFLPYAVATLLFMPTIALSNSISFSLLREGGHATVKSFPVIRAWGTVGFIASMWFVNFSGLQISPAQFLLRAVVAVVLAIYTLVLIPAPAMSSEVSNKGLISQMGYSAFRLFKRPSLAIFFTFAMAFGLLLQVTNGYVTPYIDSFATNPLYANMFVVKNGLFLVSLSQISEALCILLLPLCISRLGIRRVIVIAATAWALRYLLLLVGNPDGGVVWLLLSMFFYGIAFDFFNIAGPMFVDSMVPEQRRSCGQGMFMMMTNGFGASIGMVVAQIVVNRFTYSQFIDGRYYTVGNWDGVWLVFAIFALLIAILFALLFQEERGVLEKK